MCDSVCVCGGGAWERITQKGSGVFSKGGGSLNSSTNYGLFYKFCNAGKKDQDFTERKTVEIVL